MNEVIIELDVPDISQVKPEAIILDATAGNRMMWRHLPNRDSRFILFVDKEPNLKIRPDVICDHTNLPFKDDSFKLVVYDPVHYIGENRLPWMMNNTGETKFNGGPTWYGKPHLTRSAMMVSLNKAQREFARVSPHLALKWCELDVPLWNVLPLFDRWLVQSKKLHNSIRKRGNSDTWWVSMVRKSVLEGKS